MYLPKLNESTIYDVRTHLFKGYNDKYRVSDGELNFTKNMTLDNFPLLTSRRRRGILANLTNPQGMIAKDALMYVDGSDLYYNGAKVAGVVLSTLEKNCPKKLVSIGAYLIIFPDKIYVNTADLTDFGPLEAAFNSQSNIKYTLCEADGNPYDDADVSDDAPNNPKNGDLWIDTSESFHVLKQYSKNASMWVDVPTTYIKIETSGIGQLFEVGDGVNIEGCAGRSQIEELNNLKLVKARDDNFIVVVGILDEVYTQRNGSITISRKVPEME